MTTQQFETQTITSKILERALWRVKADGADSKAIVVLKHAIDHVRMNP